MDSDDWNENGLMDLILGFPAGHDFRVINGNEDGEHYAQASLAFMENVGDKSSYIFKPPIYLKHNELKEPLYFGHHSSSPEIYELDGEKYIIVGAEDGNRGDGGEAGR